METDLSFWSYLVLWISTAWSTTFEFLGANLKVVLVFPITVALGYVFHYFWGGRKSAVEALRILFFWIIAPSVVIFAIIFVYNLFRAPYILHRQVESKAKAQAAAFAKERNELNSEIEKLKTELQKFSEKTIDRKKIRLGLRYAYEWCRYRDAIISPIATDRWRLIVEDIPIERKFSKDAISLVLIVANQHEVLPLKNVRLGVTFPVGLKVRGERGWQEGWPNIDYNVKFQGDIAPGQGINPGALFIQFPKFGRYEIKYSIVGNDFRRIDKQFVIVLKVKC